MAYTGTLIDIINVNYVLFGGARYISMDCTACKGGFFLPRIPTNCSLNFELYAIKLLSKHLSDFLKKK